MTGELERLAATAKEMTASAGVPASLLEYLHACPICRNTEHTACPRCRC